MFVFIFTPGVSFLLVSDFVLFLITDIFLRMNNYVF